MSRVFCLADLWAAPLFGNDGVHGVAQVCLYPTWWLNKDVNS